MSPWPDHPVGGDARGPTATRRETEIGFRRLYEFQAALTTSRVREAEIDQLLTAAPAKTWPETAAKTRYLMELFAHTPEARDSRIQQLIANTFDDLNRLCDQGPPNRPPPGYL